MIYLTSYTRDGLDNKPDGPSQKLHAESIEQAASVVLHGGKPFQVRPRWWLFDVGNGKAICLSTFRFA